MTGTEFLSALKGELASLTDNQRREVMSYFAEYVAEAGNDEAALAELGNPKEVAQELLQQFKEQEILEQVPAPISNEPFLEVSELKLDLTTLDVVLERADVEQVQVEADERIMAVLDIKGQDGHLTIRQNQDFTFEQSFTIFGRGIHLFNTASITIKVPSALSLDRLDVTSVSGDVAVAGLSIGELVGQLTNGDLDLAGVQVTSATLDLINGDCLFENSRAEQLTLRLQNGDVSAKNSQFEKVTSQLANGDLDFNQVSVAQKLVLEAQNGDILMSDGQCKDLTIRNAHGDVVLRQLNFTGQLEVNLSSGDVVIDLPESLRQLLSLKLKTAWGDYSVHDASGHHRGENGSYQYGDLTQTPSLTLTTSFGDIVVN